LDGSPFATELASASAYSKPIVWQAIAPAMTSMRPAGDRPINRGPSEPLPLSVPALGQLRRHRRASTWRQLRR